MLSPTRNLAFATALAAMASMATPVMAQDAHHDLENTSLVFLGAETALSAGLVIAGRLAVGEPSTTCGWCATNSFDRGVRSVLVVEPFSKEIGYISHGVSLGVVPIVGLWGVLAPPIGADKSDHAVENAALVLNAFLLTTAIAEVAKGAFDRQRPGVFYNRAEHTQAGDFPSEKNRSFFSADTAWAFTLAASASTVAHLRGYENAGTVTWVTGSAAVLAGLMRTMADMHWPTDVLAGAAVGTTVGIVLPVLLHGRQGESIAVTPNSQGLTLQWMTVF